MDESGKKPRGPRGQQDQIQANLAETLANRLAAVTQHAETAALVAERSYDAAKIRVGAGLIEEFQRAFNLRQVEIIDMQGRAATVATDFAAAKALIAELRESSRIAYPTDKSLQKKFGVGQRPPLDQDRFLVFARACAAAARSEPHREELNGVGFKVESLLAALDAFAASRAAFLTGEQDAKAATAARDAAFQAVKDWSIPFYAAVKLALKNRPDLRTPLGL